MSIFKAGLVLTLNDELSGPLAAVERRYDRFGRTALRNADRVEEAGKGLLRAGAATAAAGAAFAAPLVLGVRAAGDFEESMADVQKVVDFGSPAGFVAFREELRGMARDSRLTHSELAAIAAAGGQRGIGASDLGAYTREIERWSTAFEVSAERAGDASGRLMNSFALGVGDLAPLGDTINALSDSTGSSAAEVLDFTERVGGSARQMRVAAGVAAVFGSRMIELGKPPETAARAFETLLSKLGDAENLTKPGLAALQELGLSAADIGRLTREDGTEGVLTFLRAVERSENPLGVLNRVIGSEMGRHVVGLTGDLKLLEDRIGFYSDSANTAGSVSTEYGRKMETLAGRLGPLKNSLADLAITVGDVLLPSLKAGADWASAFAGRVQRWAAAHPGLARALVVGTALTSAFLVVVGGGLATLGLFAQGVAAGPRAIVGFNAVSAVAPVYLRLGARRLRLFAAAQGVATAGTIRSTGSLQVFSAVARGSAAAALTSLRTGLLAAAGGVKALGLAMFTTPLGLVIGGIALAALVVYKNWDKVRAFFAGFWAGVRPGIEPIVGAFQSIWNVGRVVFGQVARFIGWLVAPGESAQSTLWAVEDAGRAVGRAAQFMFAPLNLVVTVLGKLWEWSHKAFDALSRLSGIAGPIGLVGRAARGMASFMSGTEDVASGGESGRRRRVASAGRASGSLDGIFGSRPSIPGFSPSARPPAPASPLAASATAPMVLAPNLRTGTIQAPAFSAASSSAPPGLGGLDAGGLSAAVTDWVAGGIAGAEFSSASIDRADVGSIALPAPPPPQVHVTYSPQVTMNGQVAPGEIDRALRAGEGRIVAQVIRGVSESQRLSERAVL